MRAVLVLVLGLVVACETTPEASDGGQGTVGDGGGSASPDGMVASEDAGPSSDTGADDACSAGATRDGSTPCGLNDEGVLVQDCTGGAWVDGSTCTGTDVCVNGTMQDGSTVCGLNDEGVLVQDCTGGAWVDGSTCTGTDVCVNGTTQDGSTACGLNDEGVLVQDCTGGAWVDGSTCTGTDVCVNGTMQDGSTVCGLNDEGVLVQDCTAGAWVDGSTCTGTDVCVNGTTQDGSTACGLNDEGVLVQDCTAGAWVDGSTCTGTDVCVNGTTQDGSTACGLNDEGVLVQDCTAGAWVDGSTCTGTDVCVNGTTQDGSTVCGLNDEGVLVQDCTAGAWVDGSTCTGTDACVNGTTQDGSTVCGLNDEGVLVQDCTGGAWVDGSTCTGTDVCVNGTGDESDVACGLNDEGFLLTECIGGAWEFTDDCTGTDACTNGTIRRGLTTCGATDEGRLVQSCVEGAWQDGSRCVPEEYQYLGEGECRQGDGQYPLKFSIGYWDLNPHTDGDNAEQATARCQAKCDAHSDWCLAAEVVLVGHWPSPECRLVTDVETFEGAGEVIENNSWGGSQMIDGESYQTYCGGNGSCTHTDWAGGQLYSREGYFCYVYDPPQCVNDEEQETACGDGDAGSMRQLCVDEKWVSTSRCTQRVDLGDGECRQANGEYPLVFNIGYGDLNPHTDGDNAEQAFERCEAKCLEHRDWCVAIQVVTRDIWPTPECGLVTDRAIFEGAGRTLENDTWGGAQMIDGESYQTYCAGNGDCTHTDWAGGSLHAREGYACHVYSTPVCDVDEERWVDCGDNGTVHESCVDGAWLADGGCTERVYLGEGECRQANGEYPLVFNIVYSDLNPHTDGKNAQLAHERCEAKCLEHLDWCLAIQLVTVPHWPSPECGLVTDRATFEGAGLVLENDSWGGSQTIDGQSYQTYCAGNGDCTHTNWAGGMLNPRDGYHCTILEGDDQGDED